MTKDLRHRVDQEGALAAPSRLAFGCGILGIERVLDAVTVAGSRLLRHAIPIQRDIPRVDVAIKQAPDIADEPEESGVDRAVESVAWLERAEVADEVRRVRDGEARVAVEDQPQQVGAGTLCADDEKHRLRPRPRRGAAHALAAG